MSARDLYPAGVPRFNHVAMSVPADLLAEDSRRDITRFWGEVFGFEELPTMTEDRHRLVLSCVHWEQFVFLIAEDEPMRCPRLDHFGLSVSSLDDLTGAWERAKAFREHDDRVDIIDPSVDDHEVVKIHSIYVGYIIPMMCELQYWEFAT
jgi:hypothetical protein